MGKGLVVGQTPYMVWAHEAGTFHSGDKDINSSPAAVPSMQSVLDSSVDMAAVESMVMHPVFAGRRSCQ